MPQPRTTSTSSTAATSVGADTASSARLHGSAPRWLKSLAIVSGLLATILFLLVPFLPVNQTQSSVHWPQNDSLNSVNAPLISVAPEKYEAQLPLSAVDLLRDGQSLLLGTIPADSPEATDRGLFITVNADGGLSVSILNDVVFELTSEEMADLPADAVLDLAATGDGTSISIPGTDHAESTESDLRPQVTGVYTEIDNSPENLSSLVDAGLSVDVEINSRFTTSPTLIKQVAMWAGTLLALIAVWALWRQDRCDGRGHIRGGSRRWRPTPLDGVVGVILGFWHIFGANTSDDGFILTMARVSGHAGYMANYYRWYGVPEAPFGSPYYELLAVMSEVSAASLWMRLPALVAGIGIWLLLSREILPRFGRGIAGRRVAHWTAAFMFLAFWLPYNNGVRPEPIIALGTLLAWALFERSIATDRLLPAALGTLTAAITLTCGPTGLMAVGVFLVSLPSLVRILGRRMAADDAPRLAAVSVLLPFSAAGLFVLVPIFADQTLAAVMESTRVRGIVGPSLEWYSEYVRYSTLMEQSVDGSLTRRFAMLTMLVCVALILYSVLRFGSVPGANRGPTLRLVLIVALSMFFLMFTPTKWTHHFGIYAGISGAAAALGGVVLAQIAAKSPRARTFALAGVTFLLALTFAGWNGWWYISSFGVPWWDKTPQLRGIEFNTILLVIALLILAVAIVQTFRHQYRRSQAIEEGRLDQFDAADKTAASRWTTVMTAPIAVVSILVVLFSVATFTKAFASQYPGYSVGLGNVKALTGDTSYLADEAMVETNTNESFLSPLDGVPLGESLEAGEVQGFEPGKIPEFIVPETQAAANVGAIANSSINNGSQTGNGPAASGDTGNTDDAGNAGTTTDAGSTGSTSTDTTTSADSTTRTPTSDTTGGTREATGVNGSNAQLPFNLDPFAIPVTGSWEDEPTASASITTAWYQLPERTENAPLLVVSAAGRIAHFDQDGIEEPGEDLVVEYGATRDNGEVEKLGEKVLYDIGPTPTWRNLRVPLDELPEEADTVRIVAEDTSLDPENWIAFTPPRVPELAPLSTLMDDSTPALLDWSVGLQFPTLRTFDHFAGVTEIPRYRVSPDNEGAEVLTGFMDFLGGGSLATAEAVNSSYEVPSYTRGDWNRDWGSIQRYELRADSTGTAPDPAVVDTEVITRSGTWHESNMNIRVPEED